MMNKLIIWITSARWHLSFIHILVALPIQFITSYFFNFWIGAYAVVVFFYSRKLIECEDEAKTNPNQSHATVWTAGLFPWTWDKYKVLDVVLPMATSYLIAFLVSK